MKIEELKKFIKSDEFKKVVSELYCSDNPSDIADEKERYLKLADKALDLYGDGDYHIISSPGRVEISGNHTDHQKGKVIAASINVDNLCFVKKSDDMVASFYDDKFLMNEVDLNDLTAHEEEKGNTKSIIRGTASKLKLLSLKFGGFKACQDMRVLVGSGLSSSACFEILITEIYNYLYNDEKISSVDRALISQWVENNYFGKPCGLMDQMAISVGSFVSMDFYDEKPEINRYDFSFGDYGYKLLVVNTKGDHADLTEEYAAIPMEMKNIAKYFNKEYLSRVDKKDFYSNIKNIREVVKNDRAVLRAHHYFAESDRVLEFEKALKNKDIKSILMIMKKSGDSSYKYLQNVYASSNVKMQGVSIALAISEKLIGENGICRVQGGGFAGTIQVIVETSKVKEVVEGLSDIFGSDAIIPVEIRRDGTRLVL